MSSGIAYPPPTYIPPLPIFNPIFFPQSFDTTTTSGGGGGGFTNIFPNGLTSGNVITMDGGTGGGGGTGVERTITGISYLDFVDSAETDPTNITGYITLNGNTLEIGSNTALSGINVNLLGSVVSANGVAIATGGNVSNDISNNFLVGTTQTFDGAISIDNLQSNIGQLNSNNSNTGLGNGVFSNWTSGVDNSIFGYHSAITLTSGSQNTSIGKSALVSLTTGLGNTAVGWGSMGAVVSSNYNTAIGNLSAYSLTSGTQNTSIGYQTGGYMTTGSNNVSIGYLSGVSPSAPTLSDTIAIGNFAYADATGDIILGNSGNYNSTGFPYYAKFTPNTSGQGVILQGAYNNSQNFIIETNGNSVILNGTFVDLNGSGSGAIGGVNVSNGMNINTGIVQTTDKASNPALQSLYSCFYSLGGLPYFGYNNAGTYTYQQLGTTSTNILGTYTSSACDTLLSPVAWAFDTIPNTLGNQFSFIIYSNTAKTFVVPPGIPYITNETLNAGQVSNYILAVGTAILIPYQYSNNGGPPPVITNTSGYLFTAPTSIGALTFTSTVVNPTSTGTTYTIKATNTNANPITNGSTLTLVAYNSYF